MTLRSDLLKAALGLPSGAAALCCHASSPVAPDERSLRPGHIDRVVFHSRGGRCAASVRGVIAEFATDRLRQWSSIVPLIHAAL
jgi:hypothetical protein